MYYGLTENGITLQIMHSGFPNYNTPPTCYIKQYRVSIVAQLEDKSAEYRHIFWDSILDSNLPIP